MIQTDHLQTEELSIKTAVGSFLDSFTTVEDIIVREKRGMI